METTEQIDLATDATQTLLPINSDTSRGSYHQYIYDKKRKVIYKINASKNIYCSLNVNVYDLKLNVIKSVSLQTKISGYSATNLNPTFAISDTGQIL